MSKMLTSAGAPRRDAPPVGAAVPRQSVADAAGVSERRSRQAVLHARAHRKVPLLAGPPRGNRAPPRRPVRARVVSRRPGNELRATRPGRVRGTPLLVLGAELDYIIPTREVVRTAEAYGAELQILPDLAHDVMLDTRWRLAADALLTWLVRTLRPDAGDPTAAERQSVLDQTEGGWAGQTRRPTAEEIDRWMGIGRS